MNQTRKPDDGVEDFGAACRRHGLCVDYNLTHAYNRLILHAARFRPVPAPFSLVDNIYNYYIRTSQLIDYDAIFEGYKQHSLVVQDVHSYLAHQSRLVQREALNRYDRYITRCVDTGVDLTLIGKLIQEQLEHSLYRHFPRAIPLLGFQMTEVILSADPDPYERLVHLYKDVRPPHTREYKGYHSTGVAFEIHSVDHPHNRFAYRDQDIEYNRIREEFKAHLLAHQRLRKLTLLVEDDDRR